MSDVNVMVVAVDQAIDMLNRYSSELSDVYAHGSFDIDSIRAFVKQRKDENQRQLDEILYQSYQTYCSEECCDDNYGDSSYTEAANEWLQELVLKLQRKQTRYNVLYDTVKFRCEEEKNTWNDAYRKYIEIIDTGKRMMGEYIYQLNKIGIASDSGFVIASGAADYYVVIVDSQKYPQTAEHIRYAMNRGMLEFVTLGREGAKQRRQESLRGVQTRPEYDRDEYPMACFREGGTGADVYYLSGTDNRGAGASIGRQMRGIPDGSRIRIRII